MQIAEPQHNNKPKEFITRLLPYIGCLLVILIWAGWIVLSRHGSKTPLSPLDLNGIRFSTALVFSIPFWFFYNWRRIPFYQILFIGWGAGMAYTTLCFFAMSTAKAATAGVLINGFLPFFGALIGYIWSRTRISRITCLCIAGILVADTILIGGDWEKLGNVRGVMAILLFLGASCSFSFYAVAVKRWDFRLLDIIVWIPIVNFLTNLPFWILSDSGIPSTPVRVLLTQAAYQGILVTLFAGFLVAYTIQTLGPVTSTMFMALVPAVTALLGYLFLSEPISLIELASIMLCTVSLIANGRWGHSTPSLSASSAKAQSTQ